MYRTKPSVEELFAVLDRDGRVMWSRGGSSTARRLMVYPTREAAERALNSVWIKQVIPNRDEVDVARVWRAGEVK